VSFSHVLITRPQADAERLAGLLTSMGIDSIVQPAQEFLPRTLGASELRDIERLGAPLTLIFTSPRSVEFGLPQLPHVLVEKARIAAIGPATARALAAAGKRVDVQPDSGYTSESLLETMAGQASPEGQTALVLSAPGGREALVEGLSQAGWIVRPLWVYERRAAEIESHSVEAIAEAERLLTVFTSAEAMNSLSRRLPTPAWFAICSGDWLVISERLKRLARAFGPPAIHIASGPQNTDLANTIRSLS
jgi:uroporphyrinogen-III synthase